ncbi:hypothetical protein KSP40_PGU010755 [Platanthera guangdongensis]|uniref:LysM domain-containing protein n=1 Tax=Platanthera guangdongensis TaxID=2320717 RepID=A0ABR2LR00_9ASPA
MKLVQTNSPAAALFIFAILSGIGIFTAVDARSLRGDWPCSELYVVKERETLQTISVRCNALSILDDNPQILDSDDLGPGMVLYIRPPAVNTSTALS